MASITATLKLNADRYTPNLTVQASLSATQSGKYAVNGIQTFAAGFWTAVFVGSIGSGGSLGYVYIKNNSATNYVEVATDNAGAKIFCKLLPGQFLFIPAGSGATYYARANTNACDCQTWLAEG